MFTEYANQMLAFSASQDSAASCRFACYLTGVPDIIKAAAVAAPQNGHTHTLRLSRLLTFCIRSLRLHRCALCDQAHHAGCNVTSD